MSSQARSMRSWHRLVRRTSAMAMLAASLVVAKAPLADPLRPDWDHDWVAVTVARNGAWGAATSANVVRAMVQAIRDCSRKSGAAGNDCGAEITTVRASWTLAYACGDYTFIANGDTSADARLAAIDRAVDLKEILGFELAPCKLLVAVNADGLVAPDNSRGEILSVPSNR